MSWEMTLMLFCAVGIVWMAIAMPYSRGWRYLNVRMEDCLSRSSAALKEDEPPAPKLGPIEARLRAGRKG